MIKQHNPDEWIFLFTEILKKLKITKGAVASTIIHLSDYGRKSYNDGLQTIADRLCITKSTVSITLKWLIDNEYVIIGEKKSPSEAKEILKSKPSQNFWTDGLECQWCDSKALRLHNHHYPIKKSQGGTETVNICPDCHDSFHFLVDGSGYKPTQKLLDLIRKEK